MKRKTLLAAAVMALAFLPGSVMAQNDIVETARLRESDQRDRAAVSADRFMVIRHNNDLLLIDGKTGCTWVRSDANRADNGGLPWKHEFPNGGRQNCYDVLIRLQLENARR